MLWRARRTERRTIVRKTAIDLLWRNVLVTIRNEDVRFLGGGECRPQKKETFKLTKGREKSEVRREGHLSSTINDEGRLKKRNKCSVGIFIGEV